MTKKKSLEIETENEISTFLALIIYKLKLRLSKLCDPIISTSSTYYVFSVYTVHVMFPIRPLQMNFKYE